MAWAYVSIARQRDVDKSINYRTGLAFHEAADYTLFPHILRGYRSGGTYWRCLRSLFELHTETMNAWTMIITSILSCVIFALTMLTDKNAVLLPCMCMTLSVLLHLPFTVGFHLFRCMNPQVYNLWRRLDQMFIFIASIPLTVALAYFVFPWWGTALLATVTTGVAAVACMHLWSLEPSFRRNRHHMVLFIGSVVACYWLPMAVQATMELLEQDVGAPLFCSVGVVVSLGLGGLLFANAIPEKYWPGAFDIFFSSHQLMHVGVMAAHYFEWWFVLDMMKKTAESVTS